MPKLHDIENYELRHLSGSAQVNSAKTITTNGFSQAHRYISGLITNTDSSQVIDVVVYYSDYSNSFAESALYSARLHPNETINIFSKDMPFVLARVESLKLKFIGQAGCSDLSYYISYESFTGVI